MALVECSILIVLNGLERCRRAAGPLVEASAESAGHGLDGRLHESHHDLSEKYKIVVD